MAKHRTRPPAHGYKAHIAADKDTGIIRAVETTPANEADVSVAPSIIPDAPGGDFLTGLKERGLHGVEFVVSDDHDGLKKAIGECLPDGGWQRCYVHFLRNAIDHLPRKRDDDCLKELSWLYERRNAKEARADLKAWIECWQGRYAKLAAWVEENIEETLTYFSLPQAHHKNMKSTNMLERFNAKIKRRTRVVRIFPNEASCLRLVRALAAEQHESWQEDSRYVNMTLLKEMKRERLKAAA